MEAERSIGSTMQMISVLALVACSFAARAKGKATDARVRTIFLSPPGASSMRVGKKRTWKRWRQKRGLDFVYDIFNPPRSYY